MKIKLTFALFFSLHILIAQDVFVDASVVTLSQDTLKGKLKYSNWEITPTRIEFVGTNNTTTLYTPDDIKAFKISSNNEVYISKMLKLDYFWQTDIAETQSPMVESRTENIFLRLLLRGDKASLYQFNDRDNRIRFFTEKDNQISELINYKYRKALETQSANKIVEHRKEIYKNQIPLICQDAPKNIFKTLPIYEQSAMMNFFKKYNACFLGDKVDFIAKKDKLKFGIIPFIGANYGPNIITYGNAIKYDMIGRYLNPLYGLSIQMLEPRKNYNRFIRLDAQFISTVNHADYFGNPILGYRIEKKFLTNISLVGGSYFGKGTNKIRPYAFAGASITPVTIMFPAGIGISIQKNFHLEYITTLFRVNQISIGYRINLSRK